MQRFTENNRTLTSNVIVSIVIPHYERLELLKETLHTVHLQSIPNWEAIVVDDGSCDTVYRSVQQLGSDRVKISRRTTGVKGPSACRNLGIQTAIGEYVLFLDSDDLLAPNSVEHRLEVARSRNDLDMLVFPVELFENTPGDLRQPWNDMRNGPFPDPLRRFLISDPPWCVSSTLWKRGALLSIGGFNESIMYGDDSDLHIRALLAKLEYQQYPNAQPDVYIRRSAISRITNSCSPKLLESRRTRLHEGTAALRRFAASEKLLELWEGQYFVEGEFLVFTQDDSRKEIARLKELWQKDYPKNRLRNRSAYWYLRFCSIFRTRCYLAVRIARRLAMLAFPRGWFPDQLKRKG